MKGNAHFLNVECDHCVVYKCITTHSFRSQQNAGIFTIFHHVNCKNNFVIYILECKKCHTK